jgi:nucleotide-binding universal stress UspA family protein
MFKKILIPTDGSELGREALEQGLDLARLSDGEVTILYAIETPYALVSSYAQPAESLEQQMKSYKAEATKVLREISAQAEAKGIRIRTMIVVVMATHGRKGIDRVLMGSVTDKVLHNCSTPILVVRGA